MWANMAVLDKGSTVGNDCSWSRWLFRYFCFIMVFLRWRVMICRCLCHNLEVLMPDKHLKLLVSFETIFHNECKELFRILICRVWGGITILCPFPPPPSLTFNTPFESLFEVLYMWRQQRWNETCLICPTFAGGNWYLRRKHTTVQ